MMVGRLMKNLIVLASVCALLVTGCQTSSRDSTSSDSLVNDNRASVVSDSTLSETEKSKLMAAKETLFANLSKRPTDAMSTSGPAGAIEVCQVEAKSIAIEVGKESNVRIGRTGVRLRNTSNQPPHWALKLVADRTETPVFAKLSNGHAAALLPIKLQAQCLMCHGDRDSLAPEVKTKLAKLYPQDEATGFSEGELRGWFWVESLD